MILVTGAAGKSGLAVIRAMAKAGKTCRAYIRDSKKQDLVLAAGAKEIAIGDLGDKQALAHALAGIEAIYFIAPNVHPNEIAFGQMAIELCKVMGLEHFVYHSVLFPQIESMPHHWNKLRVEEMLVQSGINFTILQPANYMQNILSYRDSILSRSHFQIPYDLNAKSTPIDLKDLAEVAANVIGNKDHYRAIYGLSGPEALSSINQAELIGKHLGKKVEAKLLDRAIWQAKAVEDRLPEEAIEALMKMFAYYDDKDFVGNPIILENLLGKAPTRFESFLLIDWPVRKAE